MDHSNNGIAVIILNNAFFYHTEVNACEEYFTFLYRRTSMLAVELAPRNVNVVRNTVCALVSVSCRATYASVFIHIIELRVGKAPKSPFPKPLEIGISEIDCSTP